MNLKHTKLICIGAMLLILFTGCLTLQTEPSKHQPTDLSATFESLNGKLYKLEESFKPYVTNNFYIDPYSEKDYQSDGNYEELVTYTFKVLETGVVTASDLKSREPYLSEYRYSQDEINGELYKRDKTFSTKILTENNYIFYLSGSTSLKSLLVSIVNNDGSEINDKDVFLLLGNEPLERLVLPPAKIEFDKFAKRYDVSTLFFNDYLIRGSVDAKTNKIAFIQLYVELTFLNDWGFIDNAIDTDGEMHEVIKISTDIDVGRVSTFLTETVAISLDRKFLEKHNNGFEIKVYGTKEKIISIPRELIESFLKGIDEAMTQSKEESNGD